MVNEEHLAILKQGAEVWNAWQEENLDIRPDLMGVDLRMADLSGVRNPGFIAHDNRLGRHLSLSPCPAKA